MADRYLIETSATDGYLLEDGSGVLLIEAAASDSGPAFIGGGYYGFREYVERAAKFRWRRRPVPSLVLASAIRSRSK